MGERTGITWTHHTFNPWWGCTKISPGCTNCYAAAFDHRLGDDHWGTAAPRKFFGDAHWRKPLAWAKRARAAGVRRRVFCASMADVFEDRPDLVVHRQRLFALIAATPELDWLLLTKRPENFRSMLPWITDYGHVHDGVHAVVHRPPWPNVWPGVTAEDQERADHRVPILLDTPAAVRFVSYEPALGPVDFQHERGWLTPYSDEQHMLRGARYTRIDWVVAGDESGSKRRPAQLDWFRAVRDQCVAAGTKYHLKQLHHEDAAVAGARDRQGKIHLPILDGRQWGEFPR